MSPSIVLDGQASTGIPALNQVIVIGSAGYWARKSLDFPRIPLIAFRTGRPAGRPFDFVLMPGWRSSVGRATDL